ncbi:MAG: 3'-5' exonuclease [Desulfobacterales bacterium]
MAIMIPENVEEFKTEGERQFYKFLEAVAKPDSRHITWYTPNIEGKEPDFILFSQNVGLIIFEVKDWMLHRIREANPQYFRLQVGYDITTNSVVISTIQSVKGLDYSVVFLLGLDFLEPKHWSEEQIEKLIYVAITRARYQLFIPYVVENQFISKFRTTDVS